jgi:hypothetical protein
MIGAPLALSAALSGIVRNLTFFARMMPPVSWMRA